MAFDGIWLRLLSCSFSVTAESKLDLCSVASRKHNLHRSNAETLFLSSIWVFPPNFAAEKLPYCQSRGCNFHRVLMYLLSSCIGHIERKQAFVESLAEALRGDDVVSFCSSFNRMTSFPTKSDDLPINLECFQLGGVPGWLSKGMPNLESANRDRWYIWEFQIYLNTR